MSILSLQPVSEACHQRLSHLTIIHPPAPVPPQAYGKLQRGQAVTLPDGTTIEPHQVMDAPCPGPLVVVLDVPSQAHLATLEGEAGKQLLAPWLVRVAVCCAWFACGGSCPVVCQRVVRIVVLILGAARMPATLGSPPVIVHCPPIVSSFYNTHRQQ